MAETPARWLGKRRPCGARSTRSGLAGRARSSLSRLDLIMKVFELVSLSWLPPKLILIVGTTDLRKAEFQQTTRHVRLVCALDRGRQRDALCHDLSHQCGKNVLPAMARAYASIRQMERLIIMMESFHLIRFRQLKSDDLNGAVQCDPRFAATAARLNLLKHALSSFRNIQEHGISDATASSTAKIAAASFSVAGR